MWEFLSVLFCGKQLEGNRKLALEIDYFRSKLRECNQKKQESVQQFLDCVQEKTRKNLEYQEHVSRLNEEVHRLRNIEIILEAALRKAVIVPDISEYIDEDSLQIVTPYNDPQYIDYELHYADLSYHVFPYDAWIQILSLIHVQVKKLFPIWTPNIGDCDNYAFTTADIMSLACKKLGLRYQAAIPILWSWTGGHAYNGFVTESDTYVYEPQNNTVIGKLGETVDAYETELILFPQ